MAVALDEIKYARVLARTLPKVIESDADLKRITAALEALDFAERPLDREEREVARLLAKLIEEYDGRADPFPPVPPAEAIELLLEQRGLTRKDLEPLVGASSVVSDVLAGKRSVSKAHVVRLSRFFRVPAEVFLHDPAPEAVDTEAIRRHVISRYVAPARRRRQVEITVSARGVHRELGLVGRYPLVCNALTAAAFLREHRLSITRQEGPPSGQGPSVKVTYRLR